MEKLYSIIKKVLKYIVIFLFSILKLFNINENGIVLDCWKGQKLKGNILNIYNELIKFDKMQIIIIGKNQDLEKCNNVKIVKSKSFSHLYYLAISKYWIVDTIYYHYLKPRKDTKYILVWHAAGIFKKFGISTVSESKELSNIYIENGKNLTDLIVSSEKIIDVYSKELCVSKERIHALGIPRTDEFVNIKQSAKYSIYMKYNIPKNKKLILYAPTFRGEGVTRFYTPLKEDMIDKLKDEYVIVLKLHSNNYIDNENEFIDKYMGNMILSKNDIIEDLMKASDLLITDYSSIFFEYALLNKPIIFFAYDLEEYIIQGRGFYMDYIKFVPGPICYSTEELLDAILNYNINKYIDRIKYIADEYQKHDGKCTKRFISYFFYNSEV